jgi:hypothetical protein
MLELATKAILSGVIIAVVSEVAKRNPGLGALITALPLVSILAMIWLWGETGDTLRIAAYTQATFWLVLPSLPLFLVMPWLLRSGWGFWLSLGLAAILTMILYLAMVWLLARFGIEL